MFANIRNRQRLDSVRHAKYSAEDFQHPPKNRPLQVNLKFQV